MGDGTMKAARLWHTAQRRFQQAKGKRGDVVLFHGQETGKQTQGLPYQ